jgi:hypothetical protein
VLHAHAEFGSRRQARAVSCWHAHDEHGMHLAKACMMAGNYHARSYHPDGEPGCRLTTSP